MSCFSWCRAGRGMQGTWHAGNGRSKASIEPKLNPLPPPLPASCSPAPQSAPPTSPALTAPPSSPPSGAPASPPSSVAEPQENAARAASSPTLSPGQRSPSAAAFAAAAGQHRQEGSSLARLIEQAEALCGPGGVSQYLPRALSRPLRGDSARPPASSAVPSLRGLPGHGASGGGSSRGGRGAGGRRSAWR